MERFYADLHLHSHFSRATSPACCLEQLHYWALKKGIAVLGTGDFTHPGWMAELRTKLEPSEPGLFRLRDALAKPMARRLPRACQGTMRFVLSAEIATIYRSASKVRKVHHLVYAPGMEQARRISLRLEKIGNIRSDGRPILALDSRDLVEIVLEVGEGCCVVPAHIWTPWFSALGSRSGFDSLAQCYRDLTSQIFAVETGLSSDPDMNRKIAFLDDLRLVSNSDAHSPSKIGREACIFETDRNYFAMMHALRTGAGYGGTIEFFPEEGKYHLNGHRKCHVRLRPDESKDNQHACPICHKPLTLGVLHRVHELATRRSPGRKRRRKDYFSLIPLQEVLSEILGVGPQSKRVAIRYDGILADSGPELRVLNDISLDDIRSNGMPLLREGIARMRAGRVIRDAGFDGEYGRIRLFDEDELRTVSIQP